MIYYKTQAEIDSIKEGGKILAEVMDAVIAKTVPGASTEELDLYAEKLIRQAGGQPSFKGYEPDFANSAFSSTLCLSINDEIVHAPATPARILQEGDILGIDMGMRYKDLYTDMARTVPVGKISGEARRLLLATQESLEAAMSAVAAGQAAFEVGAAVEKIAKKNKFSIVKDLVGHGVGKKVHEDPMIPNYPTAAARKVIFKPGMVIALEPMLNIGTEEIMLLPDGWTYSTADGSLSAQYENTLVINLDGTVENVTPTRWRMK